MEGLVSMLVLLFGVVGTLFFVNKNTRDRSTEEAIMRAQAERAKIREALAVQKEVTKTKEKAYEDAVKDFNRTSSDVE